MHTASSFSEQMIEFDRVGRYIAFVHESCYVIDGQTCMISIFHGTGMECIASFVCTYIWRLRKGFFFRSDGSEMRLFSEPPVPRGPSWQ